MPKKKSPLGDVIQNVLMLVPNIISIFSNITTLINLEARLAGKTALNIIILAVVYAILICTSWLCLLGLLLSYLITSLNLSNMLALCAVFACNIVLMIIVGIIFSRARRNLFFPVTREKCRDLRKNYDDF